MNHTAKVILHGDRLTFHIVAINDKRCPDCQREVLHPPGAEGKCPCKKRASSAVTDQAQKE